MPAPGGAVVIAVSHLVAGAAFRTAQQVAFNDLLDSLLELAARPGAAGVFNRLFRSLRHLEIRTPCVPSLGAFYRTLLGNAAMPSLGAGPRLGASPTSICRSRLWRRRRRLRRRGLRPLLDASLPPTLPPLLPWIPVHPRTPHPLAQKDLRFFMRLSTTRRAPHVVVRGRRRHRALAAAVPPLQRDFLRLAWSGQSSHGFRSIQLCW